MPDLISAITTILWRLSDWNKFATVCYLIWNSKYYRFNQFTFMNLTALLIFILRKKTYKIFTAFNNVVQNEVILHKINLKCQHKNITDKKWIMQRNSETYILSCTDKNVKVSRVLQYKKAMHYNMTATHQYRITYE